MSFEKQKSVHGEQHFCCTFPFLAKLDMFFVISFRKILSKITWFSYEKRKYWARLSFPLNFFDFNIDGD